MRQSLIPAAAMAATLAALAIPPALAQPAHETLYFQGTPTPEQVALWSALPGKHGYLIEAGDPSAYELQALAQLKNADRIQVEVQRYPSEDALPAWKALASQGVELVVLDKPGLPTADEVRRLNEAGFARCLFAIDYYPDASDARKLGDLKCEVSLTFATAAYPKFADKPGLLAIPASIPLLFASDYWPWYTHMDVLNLLPHRKRLRVLGMLPPEDELPYLRNIQRLDAVQLSTELDPEPQAWRLFDGLPLTWLSQGHVPAAPTLAALETSAQGNPPRKLVIDSDYPWTAEERARVERSGLPVEWIHFAPFSRAAGPASSARSSLR